MSRSPIEQTDAEILKTFQQLVYGYRMKHTLRYSGTRDFSAHGESDAEHVFGLLFLAQYFRPLEDPEGKLNAAKVHQMLLYHDFPEIKYGDMPYHLKTKEHEAREAEAAAEVFGNLPAPLGEEAYALWREYEARETPEARFVYALDKIEPLFELANPVAESSIKRLKFTFEQHIGVKRRAMQHFPVMSRFLEAVSEDMLARKVFWPEDTST